MLEILRINVEKNRIYSIGKGRITLEELEHYVEEMSVKLLELKEGFGLVVDLTELESFDEKVVNMMASFGIFAREFPVGKIVRIFSQSSSGKAMKELYEQKAIGKTTESVYTIEEAEKILDEL